MSEVNNAILYFLTQQGCSHCALMRPVVEQYRQAQLGNVFVLELDVNKHPQIEGWQPKAAPAFALKVGGILMATAEGSMTKVELERFVLRGAAGKEGYDEDRPTRHRRRAKANRGGVRGEPSGEGGDHAEGDE